MDLEAATQTKNFLSFIFRFAAEGWGEEARKKCKEIFGFARASPRARSRRFPAQSGRTLRVQVTTHAVRAKSGASPLEKGSRKVYDFITI
jgi:hypothetical protein